MACIRTGEYAILWVANVKRNTADKYHDVKNDVKNKNRTEKGFQAKCSEALILLAERVGFEPTVAHHHT